MNYLNMLKDASLLAGASAGDKLIGCLIVTILGMGITFAALLVLWVSILVLSKMLNPKKKEAAIAVVPQQEAAPSAGEVVKAAESNEEDEALLAVLSAAIAASLDTSIHNIVVRNLVRVSDASPAWNNAGRHEQMNTRF